MRKTEPEIQAAIAQAKMNATQVTPETPWMYLSFVDHDEFQGAVIVQGVDVGAAAARAHLLGINPGGQVLGIIIPKRDLRLFPPGARNRLLSEEEVRTKWHGRSLKEMEKAN